MDSKADFVKTIKGAKREIMTAHEVEHLKNAGRLPPAKDETSAKFAEFRALKVLPEDHTGLDILGDTIGWLDHPLREYREAAESILGCFVNRMISPQWEFPELRLHEIDTQDRLAADKIAARFLKLKKVQIISLAEHCERELRFEDEADSMGYSHNSTKEVWRRNEARFAMDAQSRMKAYLRRSYSMFT